MKTRAFFLIIVAGVLWGTSGIFVHYLAPYGFSSLQMTAVRGTVSLVSMAIALLILDRRLFLAGWKDVLLFVGSGLGFFGTASCYFAAMQATSVSTAVVLMYTSPVLVMLFSVLFLGERLTRLKMISVVCMLIGCGLVSGIIGGLRFRAVGILLGVLSAIFYSAYNIFTKSALRRGCNAMTVTLYTFFFMALASVAASKPQQIGTYVTKAPFTVILLMIGLGIFTSVLPYFLYTLALRDLPAGTASALSIVEPMAATVFSVLLFREALDAFSLIGILLILLAVFLLSRAEKTCQKNE